MARYLRLVDLMIEFGHDLGFPHTRAMGNSLFELRIKSAEGIARIFFCVKARRIVMLHLFVKKTQKTPKRELKVALSRLLEVQHGT